MDGENLSNECVICNTPYDISTHREFKLPCNHILCKSCVFELCKNSTKCPFCRKEFQVVIRQKDSSDDNNDNNDNYNYNNLRIIVNNIIMEVSLGKSIGILLTGMVAISLSAII